MSPYYDPATAETLEQHYLKVAADLVRRWASLASTSSLSAAMDAVQTSVPVAELSDFPDSGTVEIDEERITYTGRSGTTGAGNLTGAARAQLNTTAASHALDAAVRFVPADYAPRAARAERLILNYLTQTQGGIVAGKSLSGVASKSFGASAMQEVRRIIREQMGEYFAGQNETITVTSSFYTKEVV